MVSKQRAAKQGLICWRKYWMGWLHTNSFLLGWRQHWHYFKLQECPIHTQMFPDSMLEGAKIGLRNFRVGIASPGWAICRVTGTAEAMESALRNWMACIDRPFLLHLGSTQQGRPGPLCLQISVKWCWTDWLAQGQRCLCWERWLVGMCQMALSQIKLVVLMVLSNLQGWKKWALSVTGMDGRGILWLAWDGTGIFYLVLTEHLWKVE